MLEIHHVNERKDLFDEAVKFFWRHWGSSDNYKFYRDCMVHAVENRNGLPRFYIAVIDNEIVGSYAMLRNDLISRQDLFPWLACLYVVPPLRGKAYGAVILSHAIRESKDFEHIYLCSELENYYEKYGWEYTDDAYYLNGEQTKIYSIRTNR
ncbi:GNAT family N-acetyltransferase [Radiobacillus sp. PE A8.2]|uniref:GNAT family N-acetyltransferase n=1 Tax=Radiobacillus sp. PE A8.2 TaxID=3380349 RepID=UPI003890B9CA